MPSDLSAVGCSVDLTVNGIRLSGSTTSDPPGADPAAPPATKPVEGAWPNPINSTAVAETADLEEVFGVTEPVQADYSMGTEGYATSVEIDLRVGRMLGWFSLYFAPTTGVAFWALGGAAWNRDAFPSRDGATVLDVPGFGLVVETAMEGQCENRCL